MMTGEDYQELTSRLTEQTYQLGRQRGIEQCIDSLTSMDYQVDSHVMLDVLEQLLREARA